MNAGEWQRRKQRGFSNNGRKGLELGKIYVREFELRALNYSSTFSLRPSLSTAIWAAIWLASFLL